MPASTPPTSRGYAVTPLGRMLVIVSDGELTGLSFDAEGETSSIREDDQGEGPALALVRRQLDEYFAGVRTRFEIPLRPEGTPFQLEVWAALVDIPFGQTSTYARVAEAVGRPRAVRAVGAANGRNPISIVVPCHRVIGAGGGLTGYGGGLERKSRLLELERRTAQQSETAACG